MVDALLLGVVHMPAPSLPRWLDRAWDEALDEDRQRAPRPKPWPELLRGFRLPKRGRWRLEAPRFKNPLDVPAPLTWKFGGLLGSLLWMVVPRKWLWALFATGVFALQNNKMVPGTALTYNAADFVGVGLTVEAQITAAIAQAAADGVPIVFIPARNHLNVPMLPYTASLVTFNNAVRMTCEGYDPGEWNVRAYGAAGDGVTNDQIAIQAAITAASAQSIFALQGNVVKFPAGKYVHTATIRVPIALNQGQVILRGDGMSTTYLYPSGPSTNFTLSPLYPACLIFGSSAPDAAGASTQNTQYCGIEDLSTSGSLITTGDVVAVQFTQTQKCWATNHIIVGFPNNSIGMYLRGSTVTGGLGTGTTAPHAWRNSFTNCVISFVGSGNLGGRSLILQNADENYFENCVVQATTGQTAAADSIVNTLIQLGRNNIFVDCLQGGERTSLKTAYVGMVFGPPVNEAGVANGSVLGNVDYGAVMEGFDRCVWFRGDASGNTLGNAALNSNPSIYNTAYLDDNPALTQGGFVGGGNGGNIYEAPMVNIMYRAIGGPSTPTCVFANAATTPTIGGSDTWYTANDGTIVTDFLAPSGTSLDGRSIVIYLRLTTLRDANQGGGGHIRNWGRRDLVGTAFEQVVTYRSINGNWYQTSPLMPIALTAAMTIPAVAGGVATPTEAVLVSGVNVAIANYIVPAVLTAARVVGAFLNPTLGQRVTTTIVQDGTGGRNVTWNAVFKNSWVDTGNTLGKRSTISHIYDGTSWNQDGAQTPYV